MEDKKDTNREGLTQSSLFPEYIAEVILQPKPFVEPSANTKKKLEIPPGKLELIGIPSSIQKSSNDIEIIPRLVLPTRWEYLHEKIENSDIPLTTIIRPIDQAIEVIRGIIESLKTTGGCQVFVVRADTGSGKTTFFNTLPHYMHDIEFLIQTIDIESYSAEEFGQALRQIEVSKVEVNLVILEGRETPKDIPDHYIQVALANINRFARSKRVPILFVIPTVDEQVARNWCDHASKIGDLIPEYQLHEGSRWYNFPGVPKDQYMEISRATVNALNPPYDIAQYGVSEDEMRNWVDKSSTIGRFIEILANVVSTRRRHINRVIPKIRREHVWVIYCSPDLRHYDHTYLVIDRFAQDEKLRISPSKLVPSDADTTFMKGWRQSPQWAKLVASLNFLDIRLINFPIITAVSAALVYGDDQLLASFKKARLADYKQEISTAYTSAEIKLDPDIDWEQHLVARKQQPHNARESLARSNLFLLLRGMSAEQQRGGLLEPVNVLAQYLHLREIPESHIHYYIGCALKDLLEFQQFPNLIGVETEQTFVPGQSDPIPDITIHTTTDVYVLVFHFLKRQATASEIQRYALRNVIDKYMKSLPHLRSLLDTIV